MLYSTFHGNRHTRNGILQEDTTIEEYKLKKAEECYIVTVSACIFEILPIIQVLECQDIFHLLEKLVLEAEP
jgi:hypothetical protein